jgi:hypothetical protein
VSTLVSATPLGEDGESQSRKSLATRNEVSYTSEVAQQESETSMDELALDANPPAKRSFSKSHQPRHRIRTADVISSQNPRHPADNQELRHHSHQQSELDRHRPSDNQVRGRLAGPTSEVEDEVYSVPRRPELRQSQRLQSRSKDLPSPEALIEVTSTPMNHRGQPGRRITYEGKTKFVPDSSWMPRTQNGKRALYCQLLNVYTCI